MRLEGEAFGKTEKPSSMTQGLRRLELGGAVPRRQKLTGLSIIGLCAPSLP